MAMPLGHGYTIEEQITGEARHGGIQVDVFPHLGDLVTFVDASENNSEDRTALDLGMTPSQLGLSEGQQIVMDIRYVFLAVHYSH